MGESALHERIEELERKLNESEQTVRALAKGEIDSFAAGEHSTPLLLQAAQEQLRASERRFRAVFDGASDAMAIVDQKGRCLDANHAASILFGRTREQLLHGGSSFVEFTHEGDRVALEATLAPRVANGDTALRAVFRAIRPDGSTRWVEATVSNFLDDPAVGAFVGNFRDITDQKIAQAALAETQRMLEDGQQAAHLGTWASGADMTKPIVWTKELARIFGLDHAFPPTVNGFMNTVHSDDVARVIETTERAVANGQACESEHRIVRPTGDVRWVYSRTMVEGMIRWDGESAFTAIDDDGGAKYRAVGMIQDITDRKSAQVALQASELRYRQIVDNTSEGVWTYDADDLTTYMNPRMLHMLGCASQDALGKPIYTFMDDAASAEKRARVARRHRGLAERGDFRLRRKDGSELWVSLHANPVLGPDGRFESAIVLVTDITDRRAADEARNRLVSIVASSDDAIISRGVDGTIRTWNHGAEKLTQYSEQEAVGKPISMLYSQDEALRLQATRREVDEGRKLEQFEMVAIRKDGSPVEISLTSSVVRGERGEIVGASIIARDITERRRSEASLRRAEEQLRQSQKMEAVGNLAGGIAHDFNNLLSVILSYTSMIIDDLKPSDPLRPDLEEVQKAGIRATTLTRQLLAFSRQQVLQPVVLDINRVVQGVEKMLGRLLREDIHLSVLTSPVAGKVNADLGQLEQVIMNLVVNARDAMPNGGNLTVETANVLIDESYQAEHPGVVPGPYVMLAVTDTGTGMDAATKERIFEPFFTTKDKSKGTGLGLSTVYGIIQQSGGHIWVYTELGQGTAFKVYLPQTDRTVEPDVAASLPGASLRGTETILLVEDEEQVRIIMRSVLRKQGYNVIEAQNGGEAFLLCEQFAGKIHLLLTDVVMPRMSGRQLMERLIALRPDMRVLYVSGYTDDTIVHHGVLDAGVAFLQKPIMPAALMKKVRVVLDTPQRRTMLPTS